MVRILVFGDSIAYGAWDEKGGWANRLKQYLHKKFLLEKERRYYLVYNLSISGNTSRDLLKRFEFELKQRLKEREKQIVIFAIGINDSAILLKKNKNQISKEKFERNIKKLIKLARNYANSIIIVGLTPVDEKKVFPLPWNKDLGYKNEEIEKYNLILKKVSEETNAVFIDIFEDFIRKDYFSLLEDGLHPNAKGHAIIYRKIKKYFKNKKLN